MTLTTKNRAADFDTNWSTRALQSPEFTPFNPPVVPQTSGSKFTQFNGRCVRANGNIDRRSANHSRGQTGW